MPGRYLVAIPVFNEEQHLLGVLRETRRYCSNILVIDDGSTDATPDLLDGSSDVQIVRHAENRGYGASLASAFRHAMCRGYDWLITMDCDEQHEPSAIPRFVEAAASGEFDIISGSRYTGELDSGDIPPADRRRINGRITKLLNDRLGMSITDAFCGFKMYRVAALKHFSITVPGYAMPLQHWVQAWRANLRITELPVRLIYNDPTRHFGGLLDNPDSRFAHYLEVFEAEMLTGAPERALGCGCDVSAA
jgi:glycosyltransferase involved in cell wall biosynthesis